jgi:hypothetical protein
MDNQHSSTPVHQSPKSNPIPVIIIGIAVGTAFVAGVIYWYSHFVIRPAPSLPTQRISSAAGRTDSGPVLETSVITIEPLSEMHLKLVHGVVERVEAPSASGLAAKCDGKSITVTASKDAREGSHQLKVKDPQGRETIVTVNVKKKP